MECMSVPWGLLGNLLPYPACLQTLLAGVIQSTDYRSTILRRQTHKQTSRNQQRASVVQKCHRIAQKKTPAAWLKPGNIRIIWCDWFLPQLSLFTGPQARNDFVRGDCCTYLPKCDKIMLEEFSTTQSHSAKPVDARHTGQRRRDMLTSLYSLLFLALLCTNSPSPQVFFALIFILIFISFSLSVCFHLHSCVCLCCCCSSVGYFSFRRLG